MANYFLTSLKYDKMQENGSMKRVTENYLVDALSFTEAEARITEEAASLVSGEFTVSAVKRCKVAEVFRNESADKWYRAGVAFVMIDERTATEKRTVCAMLIQAIDLINAYENLIENMKGTMADFEIVSLSETSIIEVYSAKTNVEK